jgi:hypothetical protein
LFNPLGFACAAADFLALEGSDDWTVNKISREKLVVITWRDRLRATTVILDRNGNFQGIKCKTGRVELLIYGPDSTYSIQPFRIDAGITALPVEGSHLSSRDGRPYSYAGLGPSRGYGDTKFSEKLTFDLGTTATGGAVVLSMTRTGFSEIGRGYTSTELARVTAGGAAPGNIDIENWSNFEAGD